jgi:hypothetical protein
MRKSNFALRLQPSLIDEARSMAKAEGVALNQFINVAVAEKLAAIRMASYLAVRARNADIPAALEILRRAGAGNPPMEGDELPADVRLDARMRVRIEARKQFSIEQPLEAFEDTEEGETLINLVIPTGRLIFADPDYWRGIQWNGFEIVKLSLGSRWLCARREDFLRCSHPLSAEERELEAIPA